MMENAKYGILLADNEKPELELLLQSLREEYTIYTAETGEAALKMAKADPPELILLTTVLPDISGYEVLKELKESDDTRDIPVILLGTASAQDEEKGLLQGAVDYVARPLNHFILKARIGIHMKAVRQMRTIEQLGMLDALTEFPNRRCFNERIFYEWNCAARKNEPISLLSIDIDHFNHYIDQNGYAQGDELLRIAVRVIFSCLKRSTDFIARTGCDEFTVILPNTERRGALKVAEKIARKVEAMELSDKKKSKTGVTVSIGVATRSPDREDGYMDMLKEADDEMRRAMETGGNKVCVQGMDYV